MMNLLYGPDFTAGSKCKRFILGVGDFGWGFITIEPNES